MNSEKNNTPEKFATSTEHEQKAGEKSKFEFAVEWGDVETVMETDEFHSVGESTQIHIMRKTAERRIELETEAFMGVLKYDPAGAQVHLDNVIKPLRGFVHELSKLSAGQVLRKEKEEVQEEPLKKAA